MTHLIGSKVQHKEGEVTVKTNAYPLCGGMFQDAVDDLGNTVSLAIVVTKRIIELTVSGTDKTCTVYIDGVFKFCTKYERLEHAIQAAYSYANQYKHHGPRITLALKGAE
jgi:hypothetical protein